MFRNELVSENRLHGALTQYTHSVKVTNISRKDGHIWCIVSSQNVIPLHTSAWKHMEVGLKGHMELNCVND